MAKADVQMNPSGVKWTLGIGDPSEPKCDIKNTNTNHKQNASEFMKEINVNTITVLTI